MLLVNAVNTEGRPVELFVRDGKIAAVGQDLEALAGENEVVLDAGGLTVLPAFVDLHCHWRTPGFEYKEDIETGSRAAAAGGYTFVNLMPNTKPVCSSAAQAAMVEQKAAEVGLCDVNQTVSITENFDGKTLDHLKTLPASVRFITEDGHGVQDNATMARAFAICTQRDITVMSHAEDMEISPWDYRLAEDIETVRNCWLSEYYQTRLHMCHVSTRGAIEAIQMAKLRGAPVTCEVTPTTCGSPRTPATTASIRPSAPQTMWPLSLRPSAPAWWMPSPPTTHPTRKRTSSRAWPVWWAARRPSASATPSSARRRACRWNCWST